VGRVKSMRGLDDGKPEENDDVRVRGWETLLVSTRVREWTCKRRRAMERETKKERREGKRKKEMYRLQSVAEKRIGKKETVESEDER